MTVRELRALDSLPDDQEDRPIYFCDQDGDFLCVKHVWRVDRDLRENCEDREQPEQSQEVDRSFIAVA